MNNKLILCEECLHYTGIEVLEEDSDFSGGVSFTQTYPHLILGVTSEQCIIRREDIGKVIEFLQNVIK